MGRHERWIVTTPELKIKNEAKLFAPALRSSYEHPNYFKVFMDYCERGLSIRYSGSFAVDCSQIFIKGHGIYSMLTSVAHPSRLSIVYEVVPISFLIEKAGGKTSDGTGSALDIKIEG